MKRQLGSNPAESHLIYELDDNTRVTPLTIQQILNNTSKIDSHKALNKVFDLLENLRSYKSKPEDTTLKQTLIKDIQTLKISEPQKTESLSQYQGYKFNIDKLYLMNKAGGIGILERSCKFTQKGVLEYEQGKKQPKLKQIKGFTNRIEKFKDKQNLSKLQWIKQSAKFPFRIVLIDKNKADKAIYFQSLSQASSTQVYLIQKYNSKHPNQKVKGLFTNLAQERSNQVVQNFMSQFKPYSSHFKNLRKSYEKSREKTNFNMVEPNSSKQHQNRSKYDKESIFDKNIQRQSNTMSQYFSKEQRASNQMLIDDTRTQFNFKKTKANNLSSTNQKKMILPRVNLRKVNEKLKNYNEICTQKLVQLWKSKIANYPHKYKQTNRRRQSDYSKSVSDEQDNEPFQYNIVQQRQNEQVQLTNILRFNSFSLYKNSLMPFKPHVTIQIIDKKQTRTQKQQTKELKFNTFQSVNQNDQIQPVTLHYDLIVYDTFQDGNLDQRISHQVTISPDYSSHTIRFTLIDMLTDDVVIEKQISLDSMQVQDQKFSLSFNELSQNHQNFQTSSSNFPIIKLTGTIQSSNPSFNLKSLFEYLLLNLDCLTKKSHHQHDPTDYNILQGLKNKRNHQSQTIMTMIPELEPDLKLELHQLMSGRNYHLADQFGYLPIQNLQEMSPSKQELKILSICAQFIRKREYPAVQLRYLVILRMLIESNVFSSEQQLVEGFMPILMKWSGQFLSCNEDEVNLAKVIGFEDGQIDKISQKICISVQLIQFLLVQECPSLIDKMNRRNIPLSYLCLNYCHNMLAKNFQPHSCLSILTSIFNSYDKSNEILFILTLIYLCKHLQQELLNCYILQQVQFLFENSFKNPSNAGFLVNQSLPTEVQKFISQKWAQYFQGQSKHTYAQEYGKIRSKFYQAEGQELKNKKQKRFAQKSALSQRFSSINSFSSIYPPSCKPKCHCLHIYFVTVPKISGSLYLKTSLTQFECIDYEKNPYFVISNLDSKVELEFIDSKSHHYNFDLVFDAGFGFFRHQINEGKNPSTILKFQYWAGLFDESSIDYQYKNIKDIQSSISSEMTLKDLKYKLNKDFGDSKLMRAVQKVCFNNGKSDSNLQELSRKIKTAFSEFQNKVNEYDLFLHLLVQMKVSFEEKVHILFEFARSIEQELFLSNNSCFDRIIFYDFLRLMDIPIKFRQFKALYEGILSQTTETCVPKVFKARFFFIYQERKEVKLENEVYQYISQKAQKFLYTDIDLKELLNYIKPKVLVQIEQIEKQMGRKIRIDEGQLKLVISSQGQVKHYLIKVSIKNNNRDFIVDEQYLPQIPYQQQLQKATPKVLYQHNKPDVRNQNQQKMQSDLNLVSRFKPNHMKSSNLVQSRISQLIIHKNMNSTRSDFTQFQTTNLCKLILTKSRSIIRFRYKQYPNSVAFRNFNLFADLNIMCLGIKQNKQLHSIKHFFLNNQQVKSLEFLNDFTRSFKFGASQNSQLYHYRPQIGLNNNLQLLKQKNSTITRAYFYTNPQRIPRKLAGKVLMNHGFGVIRWQNTLVKGYFRVINDYKNKKSKQIYLISVNSNDMLAEKNHLKSVSLNGIQFLGQISGKALSKMGYLKI